MFGGATLVGALSLIDVTEDAVGEAGVVTGVGVDGRDLDNLMKWLGLEFFGSLDICDGLPTSCWAWIR